MGGAVENGGPLRGRAGDGANGCRRPGLAQVFVALALIFSSVSLDAPGAQATPHRESDESPKASCHGESHAQGAAVAERSRTLAEAMVSCGDRCTFGCVHGAFRTYIAQRLGPVGPRLSTEFPLRAVPPDVAREILDVCREDSAILPGFFRGNCGHSVGHAFEVVAPDERTAAAWCGLFGDAEMRFYCETGVFMEAQDAVAGAIVTGGTTFEVRAKAAVDYCAAHSLTRAACLRFVWPQPADREESRALVRACGALDQPVRRGCVHAAGFASREHLSRHPGDVKFVCDAAAPEDRAYCVAGLALMKKDHENRAVLPALCGTLDNAGLRAVCEDQAGRYYYQLDNPMVRAVVEQ